MVSLKSQETTQNVYVKTPRCLYLRDNNTANSMYKNMEEKNNSCKSVQSISQSLKSQNSLKSISKMFMEFGLDINLPGTVDKAL